MSKITPISCFHYPNFHIWIKTCVIFVAISFVLPYLTWAFDAANYPMSQVGLITVQHLGKPLALPEKLGAVSQGFQGNGKMVVHIQDLHCNYEVQMNIAKTIHHLAKAHSLKLVGEEGAFNTVNTAAISDFPIKQAREQVSDYFVKQGKLTGAEFYAAIGEYPIRLEGIETPALYEASRQAVGSFLNAESQGYCYDLREILDELKATLYNSRLKQFDARRVAWREGSLDLLKYCVHLYTSACKLKLKVDIYPQLKRFVSENQNFFSLEINPDRLFQELDKLDTVIRQQLYISEPQRELDILYRRLDIVEKLLNISVSADELAEFRTQREKYSMKEFTNFINNVRARCLSDIALAKSDAVPLQPDPEMYALDNYLQRVDDFYHLADERSIQFVDNLIRKMNRSGEKLSVMITGGFHTDHVLAELKRRGITYVSITPGLTQQDVINPYFSLLQNQQTPLEKLLAKNQNIMAMESFLQHTEAVKNFQRTFASNFRLNCEVIAAAELGVEKLKSLLEESTQAGPVCVAVDNKFYTENKALLQQMPDVHIIPTKLQAKSGESMIAIVSAAKNIAGNLKHSFQKTGQIGPYNIAYYYSSEEAKVDIEKIFHSQRQSPAARLNRISKRVLNLPRQALTWILNIPARVEIESSQAWTGAAIGIALAIFIVSGNMPGIVITGLLILSILTRRIMDLRYMQLAGVPRVVGRRILKVSKKIKPALLNEGRSDGKKPELVAAKDSRQVALTGIESKDIEREVGVPGPKLIRISARGVTSDGELTEEPVHMVLKLRVLRPNEKRLISEAMKGYENFLDNHGPVTEDQKVLRRIIQAAEILNRISLKENFHLQWGEEVKGFFVIENMQINIGPYAAVTAGIDLLGLAIPDIGLDSPHAVLLHKSILSDPTAAPVFAAELLRNLAEVLKRPEIDRKFLPGFVGRILGREIQKKSTQWMRLQHEQQRTQLKENKTLYLRKLLLLLAEAFSAGWFGAPEAQGLVLAQLFFRKLINENEIQRMLCSSNKSVQQAAKFAQQVIVGKTEEDIPYFWDQLHEQDPEMIEIIKNADEIIALIRSEQKTLPVFETEYFKTDGSKSLKQITDEPKMFANVYAKLFYDGMLSLAEIRSRAYENENEDISNSARLALGLILPELIKKGKAPAWILRDLLFSININLEVAEITAIGKVGLVCLQQGGDPAWFINYLTGGLRRVYFIAREQALRYIGSFITALIQDLGGLSKQDYMKYSAWVKAGFPYLESTTEDYFACRNPHEFLEESKQQGLRLIQNGFDYNDRRQVELAYIGTWFCGIKIRFEEFVKRVEVLAKLDEIHNGYFEKLFTKANGLKSLLLSVQGAQEQVTTQVNPNVLDNHMKKLYACKQQVDQLDWNAELKKIIPDFQLSRLYLQFLFFKMGKKPDRRVKAAIPAKPISEIFGELRANRRLFYLAAFRFLRSHLSQKRKAQSERLIFLMCELMISDAMEDSALVNQMESGPLAERIIGFENFYENYIHHLPNALDINVQKIKGFYPAMHAFSADVFQEIRKADRIEEDENKTYLLVPQNFLGVFRGRAGIIDCTFDLEYNDAYTRAMHEDMIYYFVYKGKALKGYVGLGVGKNDAKEKVLTINTINAPALDGEPLLTNLLLAIGKTAAELKCIGIALPEDLDPSFNFKNKRTLAEMSIYQSALPMHIGPWHADTWEYFKEVYGEDIFNSIEDGNFRFISLRQLAEIQAAQEALALTKSHAFGAKAATEFAEAGEMPATAAAASLLYFFAMFLFPGSPKRWVQWGRAGLKLEQVGLFGIGMLVGLGITGTPIVFMGSLLVFLFLHQPLKLIAQYRARGQLPPAERPGSIREFLQDYNWKTGFFGNFREQFKHTLPYIFLTLPAISLWFLPLAAFGLLASFIHNEFDQQIFAQVLKHAAPATERKYNIPLRKHSPVFDRLPPLRWGLVALLGTFFSLVHGIASVFGRQMPAVPTEKIINRHPTIIDLKYEYATKDDFNLADFKHSRIKIKILDKKAFGFRRYWINRLFGIPVERLIEKGKIAAEADELEIYVPRQILAALNLSPSRPEEQNANINKRPSHFTTTVAKLHLGHTLRYQVIREDTMTRRALRFARLMFSLKNLMFWQIPDYELREKSGRQPIFFVGIIPILASLAAHFLLLQWGRGLEFWLAKAVMMVLAYSIWIAGTLLTLNFIYRVPDVWALRYKADSNYELLDFRDDLRQLNGLGTELPDAWLPWIYGATDDIPSEIEQIKLTMVSTNPWWLLLGLGALSYYDPASNALGLPQNIKVLTQHRRLGKVAHEVSHYLQMQSGQSGMSAELRALREEIRMSLLAKRMQEKLSQAVERLENLRHSMGIYALQAGELEKLVAIIWKMETLLGLRSPADSFEIDSPLIDIRFIFRPYWNDMHRRPEELPMKEGLKELEHRVKNKISKKGRAVILVSGRIGSGKSYLSRQMLNRGFAGIPASKIKVIDTDVLFQKKAEIQMEVIQHALDPSNDYSIIVIDDGLLALVGSFSKSISEALEAAINIRVFKKNQEKLRVERLLDPKADFDRVFPGIDTLVMSFMNDILEHHVWIPQREEQADIILAEGFEIRVGDGKAEKLKPAPIKEPVVETPAAKLPGEPLIPESQAVPALLPKGTPDPGREARRIILAMQHPWTRRLPALVISIITFAQEFINPIANRYNVQQSSRDGYDTYIFTDVNTGNSFEIVPGCAGKIISWKVKGQEMLYFESVQASGGIEVMYPFIDRVAGNKAVYVDEKGKEHEIDLTDDDLVTAGLTKKDAAKVVYHGMVRKLPWTVEKIKFDKNGISIRTSFANRDHPEISSRFGRKGKIAVSYTLQGNELKSKIKLRNSSIATTGSHPWFKRGVGKWFISTSAKKEVVMKDMIPTKDPRREVAGTDLDLRDLQPSDTDRHAVLEDLDYDQRGMATSRLYNETDGTLIEVEQSRSLTFVVIWDLLKNKFLAIEPVSSPPDGLNEYKNPRGLKPITQKNYTAEVTYRVSTVRDKGQKPFLAAGSKKTKIVEEEPEPRKPAARAHGIIRPLAAMFRRFSQIQPLIIQRILQGLVQRINPQLYLTQLQTELAQRAPELAQASQLAIALQDEKSSVGRAYFEMSGNANKETRIAFGQVVKDYITAMDDAGRQTTEWLYFSELLKLMLPIDVMAAGYGNEVGEPLGGSRAQVLVLPTEWLQHGRNIKVLYDLWLPLPFRMNDDLIDNIFRKRMRRSPFRAA